MFFRYLKWFISALFLIGGIYFLKMATETDIKPMMGAIMCFAVVFWTSKTTYEGSKNVMIGSTIVLGGSAGLAHLVTLFAGGYLSSLYLDPGFYFWWIVLTFLTGMPVMFYIFKKDG